jgi:hypothetical protein
MLTATLACCFLMLDDDPRAAALVEPTRVMRTIRELPTQRAALGDIAHQQGLAATEALLVARLREIGHEPTLEPLRWNIERQKESDAKLLEEAKDAKKVRTMRLPETTPELAARTWHNIVVDLPGRGEHANDLFIIGAHFDAVPGAPGADDNASGTAALLELARVLKDRPLQRSVRLVFFNLEELGLKGSGEYVRRHRKELVAPGDEKTAAPKPEGAPLAQEANPASAPRTQTVIAMLSLEMLGYYCVQPGCQKSPVPAIPGVFDPPTVGDSIVLATTATNTGLAQRLEAAMNRAAATAKTFRFDIAPVPVPDLMRSDHAPFLLAGFPAIMVTDTANFRNPNYHTPQDTIETLDAERLGETVRALAGAIETLAGVTPAQTPKSLERQP